VAYEGVILGQVGRVREPVRWCPSVAPPIASFELIPDLIALVPASGAPDTVAGWAALVQPYFDHLSGAFARLISLGAASSFEMRGVRHGQRPPDSIAAAAAFAAWISGT
jgi:hypothetical protein